MLLPGKSAKQTALGAQAERRQQIRLAAIAIITTLWFNRRAHNPITGTAEITMKLFSLEEANALIPTVRLLFSQIDRARARMRRSKSEVKRAVERAALNGGIPNGHGYAESLMDFMASVETLIRIGIEIKDFERGLCDFPHWRDGRVVYLCWKRDEERIEYWHDTDAGFAGRQPI